MLSRARTLSSALYALVWLIFAFAIGVSSIFLLSQAVRNSPRQSWRANINALIIGVAYVTVVLVSIAVCLKRRIAVFRRLQRISRGHMAIGKGEVPKAVHEFISQEYARACLIAYESLPKDMQQEGWGRPGTGYDSVQFRRSLLDTVLGLDAAARLIIPSLPPLRHNDRILHHFRFIAPLIPKDEDGLSPLHYCDSAVQMARYAAREPTQREFEIGINAALQIKKILEECRLEMLEGSTTEFDRSVSAD